MRIIAILMILALNSCMVSQKTFDNKCADLQKQIDSKLPKVEFEVKDQAVRQAIDNCCKQEIK